MFSKQPSSVDNKETKEELNFDIERLLKNHVSNESRGIVKKIKEWIKPESERINYAIDMIHRINANTYAVGIKHFSNFCESSCIHKRVLRLFKIKKGWRGEPTLKEKIFASPVELPRHGKIVNIGPHIKN